MMKTITENSHSNEYININDYMNIWIIQVFTLDLYIRIKNMILTLYDIINMQLDSERAAIRNITTNNIYHDNRRYDNDAISICDFEYEQLENYDDTYMVSWSDEEGDPRIQIGLHDPIRNIPDVRDSEYEYTLFIN